MAEARFGKCVHCGKIFRRKTTKIYCSRRCNQIHFRERKGAPITVLCATCGKPFQRRTKKNFCSDHCYQRHKRNQGRRWQIDNREKWLLQSKLATARYRAGSAMLPWADQNELYAIFVNCPKDKIVDHIVPLARPELGYNYFEGRPVCGLHVPWNLQYITQRENTAKAERISRASMSTGTK